MSNLAQVTKPIGVDCDAQPDIAGRWLLIASVAIVLLSVLPRVDADPDLWGHLRFGLQHIDSGSLAATDPYSYTANGRRWINHEWLTEWTFGQVYRWAGTWGLLGLRATLLALSLACMGIVVLRSRLGKLATLAWAVFAIPITAEFFRIRPQMFTFALMAVLLLICDSYQRQRRWVLWWVPPLLVLWTNLHGGFVAGLGVFTVFVAQFAWTARFRPHPRHVWLSLGAVLALTVAGTFINPYGPGYWRFVWYAVTLPRPAISEWSSVFGTNPVVIACYFVAVLLPALAWLLSTKHDAWAEPLVFGLGVILAAEHVRHFPFLLLFGTLVLARRAPDAWDRLRTTYSSIDGSAARYAGFAWILVVCFAVSGGIHRVAHEWRLAKVEGIITVSTQTYPVSAVDFMILNNLQGNLDCGFNWGEYCLFRLYPQCLVFCDGRYETVYPDEITALGMCEREDKGSWLRRLRDYDTDMVLAPIDSSFASWVASQPDFVEIYHDETARLLIRCTDRHRELLRTLRQKPWKYPPVIPIRVAFPT